MQTEDYYHNNSGHVPHANKHSVHSTVTNRVKDAAWQKAVYRFPLIGKATGLMGLGQWKTGCKGFPPTWASPIQLDVEE